MKELKEYQSETNIKKTTYTEKENILLQVPRPKLNSKGKGIGKKTKTQKCRNILTKDIEVIEEKQILKQREYFNLIANERMPLILEDELLVTEEITIHNGNYQKEIPFLYTQQGQEPYDEITLKENDNIISSKGNTLNEKQTLADVQQKKVVQLQVQKPLKISEGKKIYVLSDEKITYKSNMKKPLEPKPSTSRSRRQSYYKNDMEILRDLMDPEV